MRISSNRFDTGYVVTMDPRRQIYADGAVAVEGRNIVAVGRTKDVLARHRAALVIDASQTAGKVPIDIEKMHIDVVAFTGHKSLFGPTGIGGLCVRDGVDIRHTQAGGTGVRSVEPYHHEEFPYRLEYGTVNLLGVSGLSAGVRWLDEQGQDRVHAQEMALVRRLRDGLAAVDGVTLYCQDRLDGHIGVLAFNLAGTEAADVGTMLDVDYDIACRTGLQCAPLLHEQRGTDKLHGAVRLSVGPFNTPAHVDTAIQAVAEIARLRKPATTAAR